MSGRSSAAPRRRRRPSSPHERRALALAGLGIDREDVHPRPFDREIGRRRPGDAGDAAIGSTAASGRIAIREGARPTMNGRFPRKLAGWSPSRGDRRVAEHHVGRAFERGPSAVHVGRRAREADETAVRLRIEIKAVAAKRQERDSRRRLGLAGVELLQKWAAAVVLAAEQSIDGEDAVIGRATEHRMADAAPAPEAT